MTAWAMRSSKTASNGFACGFSNCSAVEDGASCFFAEASVDTEERKSKNRSKDSSGVVQIICIAYSQSMLQRLFGLSLSLFRSWRLTFGVRLTARDQSVIDTGANVVHASSRSDFDGEGQQELDEATSDDEFLGEFGLLIELGDDNQGKLCGVVAVTNLRRGRPGGIPRQYRGRVSWPQGSRPREIRHRKNCLQRLPSC